MTRDILNELFEKFKSLNLLIIGDVMLDRYIRGTVVRISPEAPVPVVNAKEHEDHLGGAANVALNILSMGATPILASAIGNDETGERFLKIMNQRGLSTESIIRHQKPTTLKMRIIGNNHQLLRVDEEDDSPLDNNSAIHFKEMVLKIISEKKIDAIIFEDYDKGLINENLIREIIDIAGKHMIPVTADPKKRNFSHYKNVTLFKPNLKEIRDGLHINADSSQKQSILDADKELRNLLNNHFSLITLSEHGAFASGPGESFFLPAHVRKISDVSGAGDTVISMASLCLAAGRSLSETAFLANLAGGQVCEKPGVVPVDALQLFNEAIRCIEGEKINP